MIFSISPLTHLYVKAAATVHAQCFKKAWNQSAMASVLALSGTSGWLALLSASDDVKHPENSIQPVGLIVCRSILGEAEILTIGVAPQARRLGLGSLLLQTVHRCLMDEPLSLEVAVDNVAALALYNKLGFIKIGKRPNYYQKDNSVTVDALILQVFPTKHHLLTCKL